jgi:hypothetical protein
MPCCWRESSNSGWLVRDLGVGGEDVSTPRCHAGDVEDDRPPDPPRHDSSRHHPIRAAEEEAEHLREVAVKGESPRTPAIVVGAVLAFLVPLAAILMLLGFALYYLA